MSTYVPLHLSWTQLTRFILSFTPSDAIDMSKEKDWAASLGALLVLYLPPALCNSCIYPRQDGLGFYPHRLHETNPHRILKVSALQPLLPLSLECTRLRDD